MFERYIETDPSVCNGCFSRPLPETTDGTQVEPMGRYQLGGEHSAKYRWEPWETCPECGQLGLSAPEETLSIKAATERALQLSHRLHERRIPHDWRHLVWFVRRAKRREVLAAKDRDIAASAVEFAVSVALE